MTAHTMRPVAAFREEPRPDPASPFRDRIAGRSPEFDAAFPKAVDSEARGMYRFHGALAGNASSSVIRGMHSERRFREITTGERHLPVADVFRLATTPVREAKAAALGIVEELAAALGYRLEPIDPKTIEAHEALAELVETVGSLGGEVSRGLKNDGQLDADEAEGAMPELAAAKSSVARMEALFVQARARR